MADAPDSTTSTDDTGTNPVVTTAQTHPNNLTHDVETVIAGLKRKLKTITEPAKRAEFIFKLHNLGADVSDLVKDADGDLSGLSKDVKPVVDDAKKDAEQLKDDGEKTAKDARSLVPEGRTSSPQVTTESNGDSDVSTPAVKRGPGRPKGSTNSQ